jgi:RNA-directed DNA polymerase
VVGAVNGRLIGRGDTDVVDADLSRDFDAIPHSELMKSVARSSH